MTRQSTAIIASVLLLGVAATPALAQVEPERLLRAAGVPEPVAQLRLDVTYGELSAARPAAEHAFGLGLVEDVDGWGVFYRFPDPRPPGDASREEYFAWISSDPPPAPDAPLRRVELRFDRMRPDDVEPTWREVVRRIREAGGSDVRCTRIDTDASLLRPFDGEVRRGFRAHVSLPRTTDGRAPELSIAAIVSTRPGGQDGAVETTRAGLIIIVDPEPDAFVSAVLAGGAIECPTPA